jgi:hypothetical protein
MRERVDGNGKKEKAKAGCGAVVYDLSLEKDQWGSDLAPLPWKASCKCERKR